MAYTTINKGSSYFNTKLYTGNGGSSQSITGVGFQPDFVWIKDRPLGFDHNLFDSVRGIYKALFSNTNYVENFGQGSNTDSLTSFDTDGFSVGSDDALNDPYTYVSWNWLASNTTVSNTSGTISSTVSVNQTSGFSIVSYTGNGTSGATVGHGLGVTPKMFIIKSRGSAVNWRVYHASIGNTAGLALNTTGASDTNSGFFNNTSPSSTVFTLGDGSTVNSSSTAYIAYCFADVKGFSKFGSYTGNGSTDGTFIYTGFKPAFVMVKVSSGTTNNWTMMDNKINTYNTVTTYLLADTSGAQGTDMLLDFLSNGFKPRASFNSVNGSGYTYIYMAFAENPFVTSGGIPVTAR